MDRLFRPRSVLVVGVSPRPGNLAANIVHNLIRSGYPGRIHLFGRSPGNVCGHAIVTDWAALPRDIDLAVLLVPAAEAVAAVDACGALGCRRMVIESGGFDEHSGSGQALADELLAAARRHGIRFTGPNGIGVMDLGTPMAVPFMQFPDFPKGGDLHLLAQSGGVGIAYFEALARENLGVGCFVSMGNKLDLDECDLLDYLRGRAPRGVCLYLEDLRDGRRFFEATRDYPCPLIVQKASITKAGAKAASSHTAAVAVDDRIVDALLRQNRVARVRDLRSLVSQAKALSMPPLAGPRLAILSRSGGHAVIAADHAELHGFVLPPLPATMAAAARAARRAGVIEPANPLDLGDVFDFGVYEELARQALASSEIDGVVFVHTWGPGVERDPSRRLVAALGELSRAAGKPLFVAAIAAGEDLAALKLADELPLFESPEEAMEAAAASLWHQRAAAQRPSPGPAPLPDFAAPAEVARIVAEASPGPLPAGQALELARAMGLQVADFAVARAAAQAGPLAESLGYPLAMKLLCPDLPHKSDSGGVVLQVSSRAEAEAVDARLRGLAATLLPGAAVEGVLLQRMEPGLREVFVGGRNDPSFGPVVLVGLGGVLVEVFGDVALRLAPLAERDLDDMLAEPLSFRALQGGLRGLPAADLPALRRTLLLVSRLLLEQPRVSELDLNPLKLHRVGGGAVAVDARVRLS